MGELLAIASAVFFAASGVMVRKGSEFLDPEAGFLLSIITNAFINVAAWGVTSGAGVSSGSFSWAAVAWFLSGGAFTTLLGRWFWFRTIKSLGPSRAGTFKSGQTLFVLLASVLWLGDHISLIGMAGVAALIGGLYVLGSESGTAKAPEGGGWSGLVTGLASAAAFALGNIARKLGMLLWPDPMAGAALGATAALIGLLCVPGTWATLKRLRGVTAAHRPWNFIGVGALTSASHFTLYFALVGTPVWVVNMLLAAEPLTVPLMSFRWLPGTEGYGRRLWLSTGLVVTGVIIIALR